MEKEKSPKTLFTLFALFAARTDFELDRPALHEENSDKEGRQDAFYTEVSELNGPDTTGYFGREEVEKHPARKNDYRQQEVADIVLVALGVAELFAVSMREERVLADAAALVRVLSIDYIIGEDQPLAPAIVFEPSQEMTYNFLKGLLNKNVKEIKLEVEETSELSRTKLEAVLAICYAIFYLMELPPIRSCFEKISRNMLKYQAKDYQAGEETYSNRATNSKNQFDGPVDPITGQRPQTGTREFYGHYEELESQKSVWGQVAWTDRVLTPLPVMTDTSIQEIVKQIESMQLVA